MKTTKLMMLVFACSAAFIVATQYGAQMLAQHHAPADYQRVCEALVNEQIMAGYPQDSSICRKVL